MKPTKKRTGRETPDLSKEELDERIGGTDGEKREDFEESGTTEGEEGGGGAYGRPRELGEDEPPA